MKTSLTTLLAAAVLSATTALADPICIDFQEFNYSNNIPIGSTFESKRVGISIGVAFDEQGQPIPNGFGGITEFPQGSGNKVLALSNATACFQFACASQITLQWANAGGFVAFTVDNDTIQLAGLAPGTHTVGGATIAVNPGGAGGSITIDSLSSGIRQFCIGGSELFIDNVCHTPCPENPDCLDFEGIDRELAVGDSFVEDGIEITVIPFQGNNGTVDIGKDNLANHYGQELLISNAGISFTRGCVDAASLEIFQGAPGIEISINGESLLVNDLKDLDGITLGGVEISLAFHGSLPSATLSFSGQFDSFSIGGVELAIDHFCARRCVRDCIDFEEETLGTVYQTGESFIEDNITLFIDKFSGGSGQGTGTITDIRRANHLGQELHLEDAALTLINAPCIQTMRFHFGQAQPGTELVINGESAILQSMADFDSLTIGGASIEVVHEPVSFGIRGVVTITGQINEVTIGGLDLHLDHICLTFCPNPNCIDFEGFPWLATFGEGDVLVEDGFQMTVGKHTTSSTNTFATITTEHSANHFGQEIRLNQARLTINVPCASSVSFRAFTHNAFGVVIWANGQPLAETDLMNLDGQTVGGASISVTPGGNGSHIITLTGSIIQFAIGGSDVSVDHICFTPCTPPEDATCVDFEDLPLNETWTAFGFPFDFTLDGVTFEAQTVNNLADEQIITGTVSAGTGQLAGHLGRDLKLDNAGVLIDFGVSSVGSLRLNYGHYGSFINLFINGETVIAPDFMSLNGNEIGGVTLNVIRVAVPGGHTGILEFTGQIQNFNFIIGGEDLYLDNLCFEEFENEPPPPDPFTLGQLRILSNEPRSETERQVIMQVEVTGSPTLTLYRSTDLGDTDPWTSVPSAVFSTPIGQPNVREVSVTGPLATPRMFFRIGATD